MPRVILSLPGRDEDAAGIGDLDVTDALVIYGHPQVPRVIDGGQIDRVFDVLESGRLTLVDLVVRGGSYEFSRTSRAAAGGVLNDGDLTLRNVRVVANTTDQPLVGAAGIVNRGTLHATEVEIIDNLGGRASAVYNSGYMRIDGARISGRGESILVNAGTASLLAVTIGDELQTDFETGIVYNDGALEIEDCIFELTFGLTVRIRNRGELRIAACEIPGGLVGGILDNDGVMWVRDSLLRDSSGAIDNEGSILNTGVGVIDSTTIARVKGLTNHGELRLENVTIVGDGSSLAVEGIDNTSTLIVKSSTIVGVRDSSGITNREDGVATVESSILADNARGQDCSGAITFAGSNLVENVGDDCEILGEVDGILTGMSPHLTVLDDYGGLTPTLAPMIGSPVIDAGAEFGDPACPSMDQRGIPRSFGERCDIGAVEATSTCGDDRVDVGEQCDDGNIESEDCCSAACQLAPLPGAGDANCDDRTSAADILAVERGIATGSADCELADADGDCEFTATDLDSVIAGIYSTDRRVFRPQR